LSNHHNFSENIETILSFWGWLINNAFGRIKHIIIGNAIKKERIVITMKLLTAAEENIKISCFLLICSPPYNFNKLPTNFWMNKGSTLLSV
jgi:hypothetical protein